MPSSVKGKREGRTQSAERAMPTLLGHNRKSRISFAPDTSGLQATLCKELRMDTLPLPPRPNLDQYKKRAKSLVAAAHSDDPNAVRRWATEWIESLVACSASPPSEFVRTQYGPRRHAHRRASGGQSAARPIASRSSDAQFLIAEAHGFENWAAFAQPHRRRCRPRSARRRVRARRRRNRDRRSRDAGRRSSAPIRS